VQLEASSEGAEIVVITHDVQERAFQQALQEIRGLREVEAIAACLRAL